MFPLIAFLFIFISLTFFHFFLFFLCAGFVSYQANVAWLPINLFLFHVHVAISAARNLTNLRLDFSRIEIKEDNHIDWVEWKEKETHLRVETNFCSLSIIIFISLFEYKIPLSFAENVCYCDFQFYFGAFLCIQLACAFKRKRKVSIWGDGSFSRGFSFEFLLNSQSSIISPLSRWNANSQVEMLFNIC